MGIAHILPQNRPGVRSMRLFAALAFAAGLALSAVPAVAQDQTVLPAPGGERINTVIVYGEDPCPQSRDDEITVCARKAEEERYRIPAPLRETPSTKSESWSQRALAFETVGATGTKSCSAVGPGGSTGCLQKMIDTAYAEKKAAADVQFSAMIEAERQKRMATMDVDAAATQARVEQAEKDYEARQRVNQDAGAGAAQPPAAPLPAPQQ